MYLEKKSTCWKKIDNRICCYKKSLNTHTKLYLFRVSIIAICPNQEKLLFLL